MRDKIEDILKNKKIQWSFFEYAITSFEAESYQRLYEQDQGCQKNLFCHQDRCVQEDSYDVTIWLSQSDQEWGVVHFDIVFASGDQTSLQDIEDQIDQAIQMAQYSKSPYWPLDKDICFDLNVGTEAFCSLIYDSPQSVLDNIERELSTLLQQCEESFLACSAEVYVNKKQITFKNSFGFEHSFKKTSFYIELALGSELEKKQEVLDYQTGVSVQNFVFEDFIDRCVRQVTSLGRTIVPSSRESVSILIHMKDFSEIVDAVEDQLVSFREYQKYPHLKEEEVIYAEGERKGEAFDLSCDPFSPMMACSVPFIGNGVLPRRGCLIEDGQVKNRIVGVRESTYLSIPSNYLSGNMIVSSGSSSYEELCQMEDEVLEVVSFSSLLVDDNSLTWSSEIKLAYLRRKGEIVQMLKGGVLSGHIRKNLSCSFYSNDRVCYNRIADAYHSAIGYIGPQYVLFKEGVSLSGN